ncbi:MAG: hypothetical protein M3220_15570, partial [Chloroflexota bacterium]|nr:hypothetical protein [Chloroflexota bacterium]
LLHLAVQATLRLRGWRVRVELVSEPCSAFDQLWEHLRAHYEALVVRDRAWITYRYAEAPGLDYRILLAHRDTQPVGYLVYRMTVDDNRPTGWIADLFTAPSDTATRYALIHSAVRRLYTAGAESVRVFLAAGTPLVGQFHGAGFLPAKGEYDISIVSLADNMPHPALRDPNRWFTMAGDYDVI